MSDLFQVLSTCPRCRVESSVVELIDPGLVEGMAVESTCRLCGRIERLGEVEVEGRQFASLVEVIAALDAWAEEEGEPDAATFCAVNMQGLALEEVAAHVLRGEPVATSFDVVAFLFPGMGTGGATAQATAVETAIKTGRTLQPLPEEALRPTRTHDPFARTAVAARALAAVMLADGEIRKGELAFLQRFLAESGLQPLKTEDQRPWRPHDLAIPDDPGPIIEAMARLAHVDRQRDGTEWRVVREFARYWAYPLDKLERLGRREEHATASAMTKLWRSLRSIVISENPN